MSKPVAVYNKQLVNLEKALAIYINYDYMHLPVNIKTPVK